MDDSNWIPWHPQELAQKLDGLALPWCVVGGWALDLWHGEETRPHDDIEFAVLRQHLPHFRERLASVTIYTVDDGRITPLAPHDMPAPEAGQFWCRDEAAGCWRADMMIDSGTPEMWVCKRDPRIQHARNEMVRHNAQGVPYLGPDAVLLLKAKYQRAKDEQDFAAALPKLNSDERMRLARWLAQIHPGHPWSARLSTIPVMPPN